MTEKNEEENNQEMLGTNHHTFCFSVNLIVLNCNAMPQNKRST